MGKRIVYVASTNLRLEDIGIALSRAQFKTDGLPTVGEEKSDGLGLITTLTTRYVGYNSREHRVDVTTYDVSSQSFHNYRGGGRILCRVSTDLSEEEAYKLIAPVKKGEVCQKLEDMVLRHTDAS